MIKIENLTTGYKDKAVGKGIDAKLPAGKLTVLLGRNGTGKSTLMRTIAGFLPPLGGKVEILGRNITEYTPKELARTLSVVLTDRPNLENMKAEELIALGRTPYTGFWGRNGEEDRMAIEKAIALTGTQDLRHRDVASLSDGERQKIMIAKALAQNTPVILLDEPTAFLDYPGKTEYFRLLRRLAHEENKAILLSTHDLDIALGIADRFWLLEKESFHQGALSGEGQGADLGEKVNPVVCQGGSRGAKGTPELCPECSRGLCQGGSRGLCQGGSRGDYEIIQKAFSLPPSR